MTQEQKFDGQSEEERPLTIREYIGILSPFYTKREMEERSKDPRPLSVGEYLRVSPMITLDDMIDLGKWVRRGAQKLYRKVRQ